MPVTAAFQPRSRSATPVPAWWQSRVEQLLAARERCPSAERRLLGTSPGGQPVHVFAYGPAEPQLLGRANWNSALGAGRPEAYCRRAERQRPVLMVIAGAHGMETEGMVGADSLLRILETGRDVRGDAQPELAALLGRLRVVVVPLLNPDGRRRVPYDGFVGIPNDEMHRVGQGVRGDGVDWGYPGCKSVHPMDEGELGGYFDDAGINPMHDEWSAPMSPLTAPLLALVRREAPDLLLNLHSHEVPPSFWQTAYVPMPVKQRVHDLAARFAARLRADALPAQEPPAVRPDGDDGRMPALNLTSACFHAGAAVPITVESPMGTVGPRCCQIAYDQVLRVHHHLFSLAAEALLEGR